MSIDTTNLTATTAELLPALTADRDARVTRAAGQTELSCIEMDDAGQGEFSRVITDREASELVRLGVVRDARVDDTRTYEYHEEGGHSEELDADDMDEAVEMAEALARGGEWGDDGASVSVWVTEHDADGEEIDRRDITVEIEPNHAVLISEACGGKWDDRQERCCGTDPDDHDWTSDGEGGCTENPGVWSTGGTSMAFASHCRTCGLRRSEHTTGSQCNPGEHDTVSYEMPESWCAECQSEECGCDAE